MRGQNRRKDGRASGFTLVELLVVIGIIAVLIAILMPALGRARDQANKVVCMSNIRQICIGFMMYAQNNKDWCPWGPRADNQPYVDLPAEWVHYRGGINGAGVNSSSIASYVGTKGGPALEAILRCPADRLNNRPSFATYPYSYVMNMYFDPRSSAWFTYHKACRLGAVKRASEKIILAEENERTINDGFWAPGNYDAAGNNWTVSWDHLSIRHDNPKKESDPIPSGAFNPDVMLNKSRRGVVCFADGHVDAIPRDMAHKPEYILPRMP